MICKINTAEGERIAIVLDERSTMENIILYQQSIIAAVQATNDDLFNSEERFYLCDMLNLLSFKVDNLTKGSKSIELQTLPTV